MNTNHQINKQVSYCKVYLSYFIKQHLEKIQREENTLFISWYKGKLLLETEKTIYSWDDRYLNYVWGLKAVNWAKVKCEKVLLIGMGLGAAIYILEKKLGIYSSITAIENDPDVVRLASKYSLPRFKSKINVVCEDGHAYLLNSADQYDLIILDVCHEDNIAPEFETKACLEALKSSLASNGVLLYNRFYSYYKDQYKTDKFFKNEFRKVFPAGFLLDQNGTCLLINDKRLIVHPIK